MNATIEQYIKRSQMVFRKLLLFYNHSPHISEEIWSSLGNSGLCIDERWPKEDVQKNTDFNIAIQINGKTKEVIKVDQNLKKKENLKIVKNNKKINKFLLAKNVVREIYVPGKIINLVLK